MKIIEIQRMASVQGAYGKSRETGSGSSGMARKKDEVSISAEAMEMLQNRQVSETDKTRRIDELKKSVAAGTYYVDSGKLAEKLLPFVR